MVKKTVLFTSFTLGLFAQNVYERNCVTCHKDLPMSLERMFMHYLQMYSGEKNVKASLKHYMRYPLKDISVMSDLFIDTYGVKKKSLLSDKELEKAIDIYWEKFKVFNKLK